MDKKLLKKLIEDVAEGKVKTDEAMEKLARLPFVDMGHTKFDTHRSLRQGFPEVIFGAGKKIEHLLDLVKEANKRNGTVLITRLDTKAGATLKRKFPKGIHDPLSRTFILGRLPEKPHGLVAVVTAGTSDIPVAEEAAVTLGIMGHNVLKIYDIGVAGIHRLLGHLEPLRRAKAVIVIAGMEGALASVVGGLVCVPVIAVPTSVGYGASFGGVSALLGMLNSCSSNVSVVNIDNGFSAAMVAGLINGMVKDEV